ncbi:hypothetical protein LTS18_012745, partial [Coniosporium uncinatum]
MATSHHVRNRQSWDARASPTVSEPFSPTTPTSPISRSEGYPLSPRFLGSPSAYHDSFETGTTTESDFTHIRGGHHHHHARSQSLSKRFSVALEPLMEMVETVGEKGRKFSMAATGVREAEGLGFESPYATRRREKRGRRMWWVVLMVSLIVNLGYVTGRFSGGGFGGLGG